MNDVTRQFVRFADFELDAARRRITRAGEPLALSAKAFDVLVFFTQNAGRVVTKDEILDAVWENQFVEEANLKVQISALRKALGEKRSEPQLLVTVPGRGYKFVGEIEDGANALVIEKRTISQLVVEEEKEISSEHDAAEVSKTQTSAPFFSRLNRRIIAASVLILATLAFGGYVWQNSASEKNAPFQNISVKRLTTSGKISSAALSPDGKMFAYSLMEKDGRRSLWLGQTDGSRDIEIRPPAEVVHRSLRFAPAEGSLYFIESENYQPGALSKMPIFGGAVEKIAAKGDSFVALSPGGGQIAFRRNDAAGGKSVLMVADADGGNEREIAARPLNLSFINSTLSWAPDEKVIAFGAYGDETNKTQELFVVNLLDGQMRPLTTAGWKTIRSTVWLNDASGLVVAAADASRTPQLWFVSYPGGETRRITADLHVYGSVLYLSADDKSLLAVSAQHQSNIWVSPAGNLTAARQITFDSLGRMSGWNGLAWLPDGRIIYTASSDKTETLWAMDADGGNQKQLLPGGWFAQTPSLPGDGGFIVFESDRSGSSEVWRVRADGGDLRQLTANEKVSYPHVSPDGKWIVYISQTAQNGGLRRISADGGDPVNLNKNAVTAARFSPDGKFIACGYRDGKAEKLAILSADDGQIVKLFDTPRLANFRLSMHWTPDGQAVTYRDWHEGIWRQPLDGGAPERLRGLPPEKLYGYGFSPDGQFFAYARGAEINDVVLISDNR